MNKHEINATLIQIAHGNNEAFERLYLNTSRGVYAFLFSYFNNYADCEDVMQTVYLKIKTNISQYKFGTNGLAWILQIAKNTALNEIRRQTNFEKNIIKTHVNEPLQDNFYDNLALKNTIMLIMKKVLDEEEQRIIVLHVIWKYKHKEIAKILNCPMGTITSKYKRAVDKLKKALKEETL